MTDRDVLCSALRLIGRESIALDIEDDGYPSGEEYDVACTLMYCISATADEVARYYLPLVRTQTLSSDDGLYSFSDFEKEPVRIIKVTSGGRPVKYSLYTGYLKTAAKSIEVEYYYTPGKFLYPEDEWQPVEMDNGDVIALGAAAEYCLICGEASVAQMWEERYHAALDRARTRSAAALKIPPRRWV